MAIIEKSPTEKLLAWFSHRLTAVLKPAVLPLPIPQAPRDVVWRQDGTEPGVWVEIVRRSDGLYSLAKWKRRMISAPEFGEWEAEFPIYESGLYGSEDEARQAIPDHIDWRMS